MKRVDRLLNLIENIVDFEELVKKHDLTFEYSDDRYAWNDGKQSFNTIQKMAKEMDKETATKIWNEYVDKKLVPNARKDYYVNAKFGIKL